MAGTDLKFRKDLLGVEYPSGVFKVTREDILGYCEAVGERNPIYTDEPAARAAGYAGLVAPPAFCALFVRHQGRPEIDLEFPGRQAHAGESIEPLAPVVAGDTIHAFARLKEVYAKTGRSGTMAFIVWEAVFRNQRGEEVVRVTESHVRRGLLPED